MNFESITPKHLDAIIDRFAQDQPNAIAAVELAAGAVLAEESVMCGTIAAEAQVLLATTARQGPAMVRKLFAGVFLSGIRYGWHLRRMLTEIDQLNGLLSEDEINKLRREIAEQA